jgi:ABC-type nitrate/sulfonate/bicarbonate transport system permease component
MLEALGQSKLVLGIGLAAGALVGIVLGLAVGR